MARKQSGLRCRAAFENIDNPQFVSFGPKLYPKTDQVPFDLGHDLSVLARGQDRGVRIEQSHRTADEFEECCRRHQSDLLLGLRGDEQSKIFKLVSVADLLSEDQTVDISAKVLDRGRRRLGQMLLNEFAFGQSDL